jgi:hypothetical protein
MLWSHQKPKIIGNDVNVCDHETFSTIGAEMETPMFILPSIFNLSCLSSGVAM